MLIGQAAKFWGVLPDAAERSLVNDSARLALACIPIIQYAEAYAAHERAHAAELKTWKGNRMMKLVELHAFEAAQEKLATDEEGGE